METEYGGKQSGDNSIRKHVSHCGSTSTSQGRESGILQRQSIDESSGSSAECCCINCSRCEQRHCSYNEDSKQKCEQCEQQEKQTCVEFQTHDIRTRADNCDSKTGQSQNGYSKCANCQTKNKRCTSIMIHVRRCIIVFIVFATCGGVLFNQTYDSGRSMNNQEGQKVVKLQTVPLEEFHRQLSNVKDFKDIFKIFLNDKDLSNSDIDGILNARTDTLSRKTREEGYYNDGTDVYNEQLAEDAFAHYNEMEQNIMGSCHYPQPEIVQVRAPNKQYLPSCTILHRCRNVSGCCGDETHECGVASIKIIEKSFMVLGFVDGQVAMLSNWHEKKTFINHTECQCIKKKGLEKCDKKCPHPYVIYRSGISCMCKCPTENIKCRNIHMGKKSLHERNLKCIKDNKCYLPTCEYGDFDVKTGYCKLVRHQHHVNPVRLYVKN